MKTQLLPLGCTLLLSSGVSFARTDTADIAPPPPVIYLDVAPTNAVKTNSVFDAWTVYPAAGGAYAYTPPTSTNTIVMPGSMPGAPAVPTTPAASTNTPAAPPPAPTSAPGEEVPNQIQSTPSLQGFGTPPPI